MPDNQVNNNLVSTAHNYVFTCWPLGTIELIIHFINAASNYSCGRRSSELLSLVLRHYFSNYQLFPIFLLAVLPLPPFFTHSELSSSCPSLWQDWTQTKAGEISLTTLSPQEQIFCVCSRNLWPQGKADHWRRNRGQILFLLLPMSELTQKTNAGATEFKENISPTRITVRSSEEMWQVPTWKQHVHFPHKKCRVIALEGNTNHSLLPVVCESYLLPESDH